MEKGEKKEPFFLLPTQNSHFLYITVFHSTLTGEEKYMQAPAEARCNAAKAGSVERKMSCAARRRSTWRQFRKDVRKRWRVRQRRARELFAFVWTMRVLRMLPAKLEPSCSDYFSSLFLFPFLSPVPFPLFSCLAFNRVFARERRVLIV